AWVALLLPGVGNSERDPGVQQHSDPSRTLLTLEEATGDAGVVRCVGPSQIRHRVDRQVEHLRADGILLHLTAVYPPDPRAAGRGDLIQPVVAPEDGCVLPAAGEDTGHQGGHPLV